MFSCTAPRSACIAPMFAWTVSIEFLVSAWRAPKFSIRSRIKSTAEPGRERRDEEVDLHVYDTLEERPDLVSMCMLYYNARISNQLSTTKDQVIIIVTRQLTLS